MKYKGEYIETACNYDVGEIPDINDITRDIEYKYNFRCAYCGKKIVFNVSADEFENVYSVYDKHPCCDCKRALKEIKAKKRIIDICKKAKRKGIKFDVFFEFNEY